MHEESSVLREVNSCTEQELIAKLQRLVRADRLLSVQLLVHLGEVDARGLYRERCAARGLLEVHHHETPYALGGAASVDNLRLMCRAHNALQAERDFGRDFMLRKVAASACGA